MTASVGQLRVVLCVDERASATIRPFDKHIEVAETARGSAPRMHYCVVTIKAPSTEQVCERSMLVFRVRGGLLRTESVQQAETQRDVLAMVSVGWLAVASSRYAQATRSCAQMSASTEGVERQRRRKQSGVRECVVVRGVVSSVEYRSVRKTGRVSQQRLWQRLWPSRNKQTEGRRQLAECGCESSKER